MRAQTRRPRARTEGGKGLPHPPLECGGSARARSARERRNKIRAKAQLSLGDY